MKKFLRKHHSIITLIIGMVLLLCSGFGSRKLTFNGPLEAYTWLPIVWVVGITLLLLVFAFSDKAAKKKDNGDVIPCMPTLAELTVTSIWVGSYLILGSNATYPKIYMPFDSESHSLLSFIFEGIYYGFPLIFLIWVSIRLIILSQNKLFSHVNFYWSRWFVFLILALTVCVLWTRLDLIVRVYLSDPALRDYAKSHLHLHKNPPSHVNESHLSLVDGCFMSDMAWTPGLFTVYYTSSEDGVVWLTTVRYGPPFQGGLCYSESGPPPIRGESTYQHIYGPWYRWLCDI